MSAQLGKFQMFESQYWSGLTTKSHLASIYQASPQKASNLMTKLLATSYGGNLESSGSHRLTIRTFVMLN